MTNPEMSEKILNKQFKKTAFAGYETEDVDSFFDLVIDYLKANDKYVEEYKKQLDKVTNANKELQKIIENLSQQLIQHQATIAKYEKEGYGNVVTNKRIAELEQTVEEMKHGKQPTNK